MTPTQIVIVKKKDMKKNTLLIIGGAVVVYLLWKKSKEEETTSEFANATGRNKICYWKDESGKWVVIPCPWVARADRRG